VAWAWEWKPVCRSLYMGRNVGPTAGIAYLLHQTADTVLSYRPVVPIFGAGCYERMVQQFVLPIYRRDPAS
jgi:hypothetical protein